MCFTLSLSEALLGGIVLPPPFLLLLGAMTMLAECSGRLRGDLADEDDVGTSGLVLASTIPWLRPPLYPPSPALQYSASASSKANACAVGPGSR
jgi:hypothetical protein